MIDTLSNPTGRMVCGITVLVLLLAWESLTPYFQYFVSKAPQRSAHALRNLGLGAINALLNGLVCTALWLQVSQWATENQFGILNAAALPTEGRLLAAFLMLDAWTYLWHRLNHQLPFLWRFHRVHHSDPFMDVTTASRFHFGEIFFSCLARLPLIALAGLAIWELALYEAVAFLTAQLHHANVSFPQKIDRWLRVVFVTPLLHKVHHSRLQTETDSNYAVIFSWWDRLFRTLQLSQNPHDIRFGIERLDHRRHQTLSGLITTPLETPRSDPRD